MQPSSACKRALVSRRGCGRPGFGCSRGGVETARIEQRRDPLAGMEHAGLHGIPRRADDLSHFGDRLFMIVDEVDDLAMRRRELRQALTQSRTLALFLQNCLRAVRAVGNAARDLIVERIIGAAAQCGQRLVAGDREEPGGNLRTSFGTAGVLPDLEKHLARKVLGGGCVVHEPQRKTIDSHMMPCVEDLHGESVAGGGAFDEPLTGTVPVDVMGGKFRKRAIIQHNTPPPWVHYPPHCAAMRLLKASISESSRSRSRWRWMPSSQMEAAWRAVTAS